VFDHRALPVHATKGRGDVLRDRARCTRDYKRGNGGSKDGLSNGRDAHSQWFRPLRANNDATSVPSSRSRSNLYPFDEPRPW
jgi:hypothetical protein